MDAINQDLLRNRTKWPWLKGYTDKCRVSQGAIFYGPPFVYNPNAKKSGPHDHLFLSITSIANTSGFMYSTAFDKLPACQFPKDGMKLYGNVVDHDPAGEKFRQWVIHMVLDECKKV